MRSWLWRREFGWMAVGFGWIFVVAGVAQGISRWRFLDRAVRTHAVVVGIDETPDEDGGSMKTPRLSFDVGGRRVEFRGGLPMSPSPYSVGDRVAVVYDPQAPEKAEINHWFQLWFQPFLAVLIGGFLAASKRMWSSP